MGGIFAPVTVFFIIGGVMKVYLSGMITGDSNYRQKFNAMAEELLSYGYVVFNPAVLPDGFDYEDYMDFDLLILSRCDAIFLMRDWKTIIHHLSTSCLVI